MVTTDGPYAETKEVLTGFYLLECADLDEAISWRPDPGAWDGAVEVRPSSTSGGVTPCPPTTFPRRRPRHRRALVRLVRDEGRAVLATLTRTSATSAWPRTRCRTPSCRPGDVWARDGVPPNPRAWLLTVAATGPSTGSGASRPGTDGAEAMGCSSGTPSPRAIDGARRPPAARLHLLSPEPGPRHPVALALRTLCGLTTEEVARALLVARRPWPSASPGPARRSPWPTSLPGAAGPRAARPPGHGHHHRLPGVQRGLRGHLGRPRRPTLADEAIRLAVSWSSCCRARRASEGLLALMLLQHARRDARVDGDGALVLLADQDRSRWDQGAIAEGVVLVGEGLRRTPDRPDPYVVQAAIAACHALAPTFADTDWAAIVSWYDVLLTVTDTPIVRLNLAAATPSSTDRPPPSPSSTRSTGSTTTRSGTRPGPSCCPASVAPRPASPSTGPSPSPSPSPSADSSSCARYPLTPFS